MNLLKYSNEMKGYFTICKRDLNIFYKIGKHRSKKKRKKLYLTWCKKLNKCK